MMDQKTLVIQNLQGIGDTMWFVRHLQAIAQRTSSGKVSLLTRPRSMADQILKHDPRIDQVLWLQIKEGVHDGVMGTLRLAQLIRSHKFEMVWVLHSRSLRYALACRLAGVSHIYGPGIGLQRFFLKNPPFLEGVEQSQHPIVRGTRLLEKHGLKLPFKTAPLCLGDKDQKWTKNTLQSYSKPFIGLGIASSESHKKWPWESYVHLARRLCEQSGGTIFVLGGAQEREEAARIVQTLRDFDVTAMSVTHHAIGQSLALLGHLDFIVGNDTGILHAAPMVGTKGLVLLGKAQVPIHHYAMVEGLHLAPDEKPFGEHNDLHQHSVDAVLEKLLALGWIS